jgi:hypothetical protein
MFFARIKQHEIRAEQEICGFCFLLGDDLWLFLESTQSAILWLECFSLWFLHKLRILRIYD